MIGRKSYKVENWLGRKYDQKRGTGAHLGQYALIFGHIFSFKKLLGLLSEIKDIRQKDIRPNITSQAFPHNDKEV